jgi:hypothetical protein
MAEKTVKKEQVPRGEVSAFAVDYRVEEQGDSLRIIV